MADIVRLLFPDVWRAWFFFAQDSTSNGACAQSTPWLGLFGVGFKKRLAFQHIGFYSDAMTGRKIEGSVMLL